MMQVFPGNDHSNDDHSSSESPSSVPQKRKRTSEDFGEMTPEQLALIRIEQATMDRLHTGVPASDNQNDFWCDRFDIFRMKSLKQDLKDTPTLDDLEVFIRYISPQLKGRGDDGAAQLDYVYTGLLLIQKNLIFRYQDFVSGQHEQSRINATLVDLLKKGILTREPCIRKYRVTSEIVGLMIKAMLQDGIRNGTLSWDTLIMKALSLLLQSMLGARAGDIRRSQGYDGLECLLWEHITICLDSDEETPIFRCSITLFHAKGSLRSQKPPMSTEFEEFPDRNVNCLCPIKLLLCHAMRTEAVAETSWRELKRSAGQRPNRRVIWAHPKRPVICHINCNSKLLDLEKPSRYQAAGTCLTEAQNLLGIVEPLTPHDIRRGAAFEACNQTGPGLNTALEQAREFLGHSDQSLLDGTTEDYVGTVKDNMWKKRVYNPIPLPPVDILNMTANVYQLRKRTPAAITRECINRGLDPALKGDRMEASSRSRQEDYNKWLEEEQAKLDDKSANATVSLADSEATINAHPDDFVNYFSRINVCRFEDTRQGLPRCAKPGGSKDEPTRFIYKCKTRGCHKEYINLIRLQKHFAGCKAQFVCGTCEAEFHSRDELVSHIDEVAECLPEDTKFEHFCARCNKLYDTAEQLEGHDKRQHSWIPKACDWPDCQDPTVFETQSSYRSHQFKHQNTVDQCWVCKNGFRFSDSRSLRQHIRRCHPEVNQEEIKDRISAPRINTIMDSSDDESLPQESQSTYPASSSTSVSSIGYIPTLSPNLQAKPEPAIASRLLVKSESATTTRASINSIPAATSASSENQIPGLWLQLKAPEIRDSDNIASLQEPRRNPTRRARKPAQTLEEPMSTLISYGTADHDYIPMSGFESGYSDDDLETYP